MALPAVLSSFSLEGPEGKAFLTRSRVFSDAEWADLRGEDKRIP
ncbi:MAG: hypothetical protein Q8M11_19575 [Sulfuritalea sp.]|nr:hypothetical protein [Sulfuritalea sp.]